MPFQKGQSGNPNGRPKKKHTVAYELEKLLNERDKTKRKTKRRLLVEAMYKAGVAGNVSAMNLIIERIEGKPLTSVEVSGRDDSPLRVEHTLVDKALIDVEVQELLGLAFLKLTAGPEALESVPLQCTVTDAECTVTDEDRQE